MTKFPTVSTHSSAGLATSTLVLLHQPSVHHHQYGLVQSFNSTHTHQLTKSNFTTSTTWAHVGMCLFSTHTETSPLSDLRFASIVSSVKILQTVGELNITTFNTASNGVSSFKCQSPPVICRLCASTHHWGRHSNLHLVITSTIQVC